MADMVLDVLDGKRLIAGVQQCAEVEAPEADHRAGKYLVAWRLGGTAGLRFEGVRSQADQLFEAVIPTPQLRRQVRTRIPGGGWPWWC